MKVDKFLILIILSILLLCFFTSWHLKTFKKPLPEIKGPEIEIPKPESLFESEEEMRKFVSPDGKLKFKYPSGWMEMPKENGQAVADEEGEILFFATKFKIETATLASLIAQELSWEGNIEELIKKMEDTAQEKGGEMKILNLEVEDKTASFKAKYAKTGETNFISKEKIILGEGKAYLISIFSLERFWPEYDKEADEILNSIEFTP